MVYFAAEKISVKALERFSVIEVKLCQLYTADEVQTQVIPFQWLDQIALSLRNHS